MTSHDPFVSLVGCLLVVMSTKGIPVPLGFDQSHVMYVWFDALTNYLTGIHALVRADGDNRARCGRGGYIL